MIARPRSPTSFQPDRRSAKHELFHASSCSIIAMHYKPSVQLSGRRRFDLFGSPLVRPRMTELAEAFSALLADDDTSAVPQQPASTQRQTIALPEFDAFLPRRLSLIVDAGPGCGGVTWPAALVLSRCARGMGARSETLDIWPAAMSARPAATPIWTFWSSAAARAS